MNIIKVLPCLTLLILSWNPKFIYSQVPELINFQGSLDQTGSNSMSGDFIMIFSLYDTETEGDILWSEQHDNVRVSNGQFQVLIGNGILRNPMTNLSEVLVEKSELYLGFRIGTEPEFESRFRFSSVPYARVADKALRTGFITCEIENADENVIQGGETRFNNRHNYVEWSESMCSGIPDDSCQGMLSVAVAQGMDENWTVVNPGGQVGWSSVIGDGTEFRFGGIAWAIRGESDGSLPVESATIRVIYICN